LTPNHSGDFTPSLVERNSMPPKSKFSREDIVEIAFDAVRKHGWEGLSARYIAKKLNSSTMPVYSYFKSMKDLADEVVRKTYELIISYGSRQRTGDLWLDMEVGYVIFARDEKQLFRALMDERYVDLRRKYSEKAFVLMGERLADYPGFQGLTKEQTDLVRIRAIIFAYGLASFVNISFSGTEATEEGITDLLRENTKVLLRAVQEGWAENLDEVPDGCRE
jgi:AcrR family transcriptional regulator